MLDMGSLQLLLQPAIFVVLDSSFEMKDCCASRSVSSSRNARRQGVFGLGCARPRRSPSGVPRPGGAPLAARIHGRHAWPGGHPVGGVDGPAAIVSDALATCEFRRSRCVVRLDMPVFFAKFFQLVSSPAQRTLRAPGEQRSARRDGRLTPRGHYPPMRQSPPPGRSAALSTQPWPGSRLPPSLAEERAVLPGRWRDPPRQGANNSSVCSWCMRCRRRGFLRAGLPAFSARAVAPRPSSPLEHGRPSSL